MREIALQKAGETARKTAEEMGLEFVSARNYRDEDGTDFLEITVDHDYSITIDEIESYSQVLGERLDLIEELDQSYMLDVCSPGAERDVPVEDLPKLIGRYLEVVAANLKKGDRAEGTIESVEDGILTLKRFIKGQKKVYRIPLEDIKSCRLTVRP